MFWLLVEALVVTAFFLMLKDQPSEKVFWLNLAVSVIVIAIVFYRSTDIFGNLEDRKSKQGGLGLRWMSVGIYAPLAILAVVVSYFYGQENFNMWLLIQMGLLLLFVLYNLLGNIANNATVRADAVNKERRSLIDSINSSLLRLNMDLPSDPAIAEALSRVKEEVRFITPSDAPDAREMEGRILESLSNVSADPAHAVELLEKTSKLIEIRKRV